VIADYSVHGYGIYLQGHMTGRSCLTVPSGPFTFSDVLIAIKGSEKRKERNKELKTE
jgi:hypothetical protein